MLNRPTSERGAILIMVSIALLGLMAFSTIVIDYGLMWVGRNQIQTSADAGALSGAIALAWEDADDFDAAREKAQGVAKHNLVWNQQPDVLLTDVTFPPCPPGAPGAPDTCVKVDAFRNQARNNPLNVFFGHLIGISEQGVRATATAQVATANTTECLRPWAVLDRWSEFGEPFSPTSTYDKYSDGQGSSPPQEADEYIPPDGDDPGTGFSLPADAGRQFAIKTDSNENATTSPGWFRAIQIPRLDGMTGGNVYEANITSCGGYPTSWFEPFTYLGVDYDDCPTDVTTGPMGSNDDNKVFWAAHGCFNVETGNKVGPTDHGMDDLFDLEPRNLVWVGGIGGHVEDTAHPGEVVTDSKRIVPIGVIDIDHFLSADPHGNNATAKIVNIYGFFLEGMGSVDEDTGAITVPDPGGKAVVGRIMTLQGTGLSTHHTSSSFLRTVVLVR